MVLWRLMFRLVPGKIMRCLGLLEAWLFALRLTASYSVMAAESVCVEMSQRFWALYYWGDLWMFGACLDDLLELIPLSPCFVLLARA